MGKHRHTPEIEQILGLTDRVVFTPHLAPLKRGLLSTVTLPLTPQAIDSLALEDVVDYYKQFYAGRTFVRVLDAGQQPKTASVVGTNARPDWPCVQQARGRAGGDGRHRQSVQGCCGPSGPVRQYRLWL